MTDERDWPFERSAKGTLRPWFLSATGYLAVLFRDPAEAGKACHGLLDCGVPETDIRRYDADDVLRLAAQRDKERSRLAKLVAAVTVDRTAWDRFLTNARAGGVALWVYVPTEDAAQRLSRVLAPYDYLSMRYYGDQGTETIRRGEPGS